MRVAVGVDLSVRVARGIVPEAMVLVAIEVGVAVVVGEGTIGFTTSVRLGEGASDLGLAGRAGTVAVAVAVAVTPGLRVALGVGV
jgi:hypothetical protein